LLLLSIPEKNHIRQTWFTQWWPYRKNRFRGTTHTKHDDK